MSAILLQQIAYVNAGTLYVRGQPGAGERAEISTLGREALDCDGQSFGCGGCEIERSVWHEEFRIKRHLVF
jgi:hypothetical protein